MLRGIPILRQKGSNMRQTVTVKELPDSEKPYEKFRMSGPEVLSDAELLAVIIRTGTNGRKSIEVAQDFLNLDDRSLLNLYSVSYRDMQQINGIGEVKAIQLKCIAELSRRIAMAKYRSRVCLNNPRSIAEYCMERMRHAAREVLWVMLFDIKCHLIDTICLSTGSATSTFVPAREIFAAALQYGAVQIVLLHNHPSGDPGPSHEDIKATLQVAECGKMLGITLADHIIIGDHQYISFREKGMLN